MRSKKVHLFLLCLFSGIYQVSAQNYYHLRKDGSLPKGFYLDKIYESKVKSLLDAPSAGKMSVTDTIPFDFHFYGQTFRFYKTADNGYISFDTSVTNSEIPNGQVPKNSIFPFFENFKLQTLPAPNQGVNVKVIAYSDGVAPNRSYVIQYFGLSLDSDPLNGSITNSNIYAFAIVLHEGNEGVFDLVYTPYGDKTRKAAIGCSNSDGSVYKLLNDSLSYLPFQFSFEKNNFIVYEFRQGVQPVYDMSLAKLNLEDVYPVNAVVNLSAEVVNLGSSDISSFDLNYSVNQSDTFVYALTAVNLKHNGEGRLTITHPVSWVSGTAGSLNNVNVWLSNLNGNNDQLSTNSNHTYQVLRNNNNYTAERNILFEEGTGAWCGYCPEAHLIMAKAIDLYGKRIVPVSFHFNDSMKNVQGDTVLGEYYTSYPDAVLDRKVFLGITTTWLDQIASRLNGNSPVEIKIDQKSYNESTREIRFRVRAIFSDYWIGNLNLNAYVTHDHVRGGDNPNIWSQNNFYSKDHSGGFGGPNHPLYNEKEFMPGYLHQHVFLAAPSGVWGQNGIIPSYITPNSEFSQTFSYLLPPLQKVSYRNDYNSIYCDTRDDPGQDEGMFIPAYIRFVGFVSYQNNDPMQRSVLNSEVEELWNLVGLQPLEANQNQLLCFPNPAGQNINFKLNISSSASHALKIFDANGKLVHQEGFYLDSGPNILSIDTSDLLNGVYRVVISSDQSILSSSFVIAQ